MPRHAAGNFTGQVRRRWTALCDFLYDYPDLLYMGDVTVYMVDTPGGRRIEALRANSASGRAQFFEVGDTVELSWPVAAGHFIEE